MSLKKGSRNVINGPLAEPLKVLIPPLHIKSGLMKHFPIVGCYIKKGIYDGPEIRQLLKDEIFVIKMTSIEKRACRNFENMVEKFRRNCKSPECKKNISKMVNSFNIWSVQWCFSITYSKIKFFEVMSKTNHKRYYFDLRFGFNDSKYIGIYEALRAKGK